MGIDMIYTVSTLGVLLACYTAFMLWKTDKENKALEKEAENG